MNRRQRRIQKRRVRRVGIMLASVAMLGATAGLGGAAFAGEATVTNTTDHGPGPRTLHQTVQMTNTQENEVTLDVIAGDSVFLLTEHVNPQNMFCTSRAEGRYPCDCK